MAGKQISGLWKVSLSSHSSWKRFRSRPDPLFCLKLRRLVSPFPVSSQPHFRRFLKCFLPRVKRGWGGTSICHLPTTFLNFFLFSSYFEEKSWNKLMLYFFQVKQFKYHSHKKLQKLSFKIWFFNESVSHYKQWVMTYHCIANKRRYPFRKKSLRLLLVGYELIENSSRINKWPES